MSFIDDFKRQFSQPNNTLNQLIIINVVVFVVLAVLGRFSEWFSFREVAIIIDNQFTIPPIFDDFIYRPWTLITYSFNHAGIFHILFNMLGLYWFGMLIRDFLGGQKLVNLYILGALGGAIVFLLAFNLTPFYQNMSAFHGMVGASAAVIAIVVAAATLMPDHQFFLLFFGPVKIKYIALFYVFSSFYQITGPNAGGEIAHLGGALMGFIYMKQLQAGNDWGMWITVSMEWFRSLFAPRPKIKVSHRKTSSPKTPKAPKSSNTDQAEIDKILDKISDKGYEALSKEEKEKLFNASKK